MQITTVAVTGATGFVGRSITAELLRRGYHVRALVRDADRAAAVLPNDKNLKLIVGDVLDRVSPAKLVEGAQACINLIGIIRESRTGGHTQTFRGMHVDATKALLDACRAGGVSRFVQMSAIGIAPDVKAEYATTKYEAEQLVKRSGLDWTIHRCGFIHGPDAEAMLMFRKQLSGDAFPWFVMPFFARETDHEEGVILPRLSLDAAKIAPVFVEDVAQVFAETLSRPQTIEEMYNVVGPDAMDWRGFLEFLRESLPGADGAVTVIPMPSSHAAMMAKAAKVFGMGGWLPFDEGQPVMGSRDADADLSKVRAHFGIEPRGLKETVAEYVGQMPAMV